MRQIHLMRVLLLFSAAGMLASSAPAQQPATATADPFSAGHAELMRTAQAQLERLQAGAAAAAAPSPVAAPRAASLSPADVLPNPLAAIDSARVERARKRLLDAGVDAERVFQEEGVPPQLLVIAEVESGFNPLALSLKGACGLWQLMPETARRYGLRVDEKVDERLHPGRATRAAARYLRDLYLLFGDWRLALAAYNAGEQRVTDALASVAGRDYAEVADALPRETQLYVPAIFKSADAQYGNGWPAPVAGSVRLRRGNQ